MSFLYINMVVTAREKLLLYTDAVAKSKNFLAGVITAWKKGCYCPQMLLLQPGRMLLMDKYVVFANTERAVFAVVVVARELQGVFFLPPPALKS